MTTEYYPSAKGDEAYISEKLPPPSFAVMPDKPTAVGGIAIPQEQIDAHQRYALAMQGDDPEEKAAAAKALAAHDSLAYVPALGTPEVKPTGKVSRTLTDPAVEALAKYVQEAHANGIGVGLVEVGAELKKHTGSKAYVPSHSSELGKLSPPDILA